MIEKNSHKLIYTIGAIVLACLLIAAIKVFASSSFKDIMARIQNPAANYVAMGSENMTASQYWYGSDIIARDRNSLTFQIPATPNRTDTDYWYGDAGLQVGTELNVRVPYHHTLTETYQVYIESDDKSVSQLPYVVNVSNHYSDPALQAQAHGDDLDSGTANARSITVGQVHYQQYWHNVPVNTWLNVTISYQNNSLLKGELIDTTGGGIINLSSDPAKVEYRDFAYEVN